jgi:hypothetical protein
LSIGYAFRAKHVCTSHTKDEHVTWLVMECSCRARLLRRTVKAKKEPPGSM